MALEFPYEEDINLIDKYDIYKYWRQKSDPYIKGIPVVFFTTPVMNLTSENSQRDGFFTTMKDNFPDLYRSLTCIDPTASGTISKKGPSNSPFIKILSNSFQGIEGKDLTSKTIEIAETFYGYKQVLPGPYVDSVTGDTVSVRYLESKNLHIIRLHKLWMDYIEYVSRGFFVPYNMVRNYNEIDYVSTLYYFVLDYDFSTILYYSRYVGVAPISNPYSSLIASIGEGADIPQINIDYVYSYKQDLTPEILIDFNRVANSAYSDLRGSTNEMAKYNMNYYSNNYYNLSESGKNEKISSSKYSNVKIVKVSMDSKIGSSDRDLSSNFGNGIMPSMAYKLVFE